MTVKCSQSFLLSNIFCLVRCSKVGNKDAKIGPQNMLPFNSIHSLNGFLFSLLTPSLSQRRGLPLRNLVRHLSEHLSTVQVARNASLPGPKLARRLLPLDLAAVVVVPVVPSSPQLGLLGRNEEYACTCRDSTLNIILLPCELLCCFCFFIFLHATHAQMSG